MAQHTPGPWLVLKGAAEGDDMRCAVVVERGKMQYLLATIENGAPGDFCETEEANAKLIAAAPVMLGAVKLAHAVLWQASGMSIGEYENTATGAQLRAAIAKAES